MVRPNDDITQRAHAAKDRCWECAHQLSHGDRVISKRLLENAILQIVIARLCRDSDPDVEARNVEAFFDEVLAELRR
jgi:hypothetical protein